MVEREDRKDVASEIGALSLVWSLRVPQDPDVYNNERNIETV